MAKVVLLNSGGLDSALVAKWLKNQGHEIRSLFIETDCINNAREKAASQTTATKFCNGHYVYQFKFGMIPNHWECRTPRDQMDAATKAFYPTDPPIRWYSDVPDPIAARAARPFQEFLVLPNRSMVFYSFAVCYAKIVGATQVYGGSRLTQDEQYQNAYNQMADMNRLQTTRPELVLPFNAAISYAAAAEILLGHVPTAAEVAALQAEFAYTYSCRWPTPCGVCDKCTGRAEIGLV